MIGHEPGWAGAFTRNEAPLAMPNGTVVEKVNSEPRDGTPNGTRGRILGSVAHDGMILYFVEWTTMPRVAVGCMAFKIRAAD